MSRTFSDQVEFITVYLREAHPIDGLRTAANDRVGILVKQPISLVERAAVADRCYSTLRMKSQMVVDEMDDRVGRAYCAEPDRIYLIDDAGRVAYRGAPGPFGFNPIELEQTILLMLLGNQ